MGLDLVVEGCAKHGHEMEWRELLERAFSDENLSEVEIAHFNSISIPGYQRIGAPRVGSDATADEWIIEAQDARTPEAIEATLKEFSGYYVLELAQCDGVPAYSNGGLYDGVDKTSFRGDFLKLCENVINKQLLDQAWVHKFPETAIEYGRALLAAADAATTSPLKARKKLLTRLGILKPHEPLPLSEQMDVVRAAGRWFIFWGQKGHAIRAYF